MELVSSCVEKSGYVVWVSGVVTSWMQALLCRKLEVLGVHCVAWCTYGVVAVHKRVCLGHERS